MSTDMEAVICPVCTGSGRQRDGSPGSSRRNCPACNGVGALTQTASPEWRRVYPGCYETYVAADFERGGETFRGPVRLVVRHIPEWPRVYQWANEAWLMADEDHGGPEQIIHADDGPEARKCDAQAAAVSSALAGWSRDRQLGWCLRA